MYDNKTYTVYRYYQNDRRPMIQRRGLSLKQAQAWCNDPETSSHTARKPRGCDNDAAMIDRWSEKNKHWFDGYTAE